MALAPGAAKVASMAGGGPMAQAANATGEDTSGTWRRYQYVLWTDVAAPLPAFLLFFVFLIAALLIATPILARHGISQADLYKQVPLLARQPAMMQALTALSDLVLLFFLWRIARRVAASSLVARYRSAGRIVPLICLIGGVALAFSVIVGLSQLAAHEIVKFHPRPEERFFVDGASYQYPIVILTAAIVAPFVEEFYFRGVLLSWLGRKITILPAIVVSAALFGLLHFRFSSHPGAEGWVLTGVIALIGLVNAILAVRTKSLWPPFALHAGYNGTLVVLALLPRLTG